MPSQDRISAAPGTKHSALDYRMRAVQTVRATARHGRAIDAVTDLLARLRIDFIFVGSVARSAWLGGTVDSGAVDVIALMREEQKNQVAMMGSNRGFRVERDEILQSEELDLVPLNFIDPDGDVRVHVLLATNALYGRMVSSAASATWNDKQVKIATAEDLALLMSVAEDSQSVRDREMIIGLPEFNRRMYNQRLVSIGLPHLAVAE